MRARLEDVVDREFADLREGELKEEIERLGAALAAAAAAAPDAEEQLAPLRDALAAAQDARDQATERATALAARVDALEPSARSARAAQRRSSGWRELRRGAPEELLAPLRAELAAAQAEASTAGGPSARASWRASAPSTRRS